VLFDGVTDLTRLDETRIAELGIGRKFQKPTVFESQTIEDNLLLAQDPKLLLVDEPVAGMTDVETHQTAELLKEINKDKTVMVVEHDMTFVRELGVKVTCLHEGTVLAEGTIDQVSANERVVEVYLGR
jgi:urea transport system ATP-binding protein